MTSRAVVALLAVLWMLSGVPVVGALERGTEGAELWFWRWWCAGILLAVLYVVAHRGWN